MVETRHIMICSLADETLLPVPGSIKVECHSCHKELWLSPPSQVVIERLGEMEIFCVLCGMREVEKEIYKEKNDEINENIKKDNER